MDLATLLSNPALAACWLAEASSTEITALAAELHTHRSAACSRQAPQRAATDAFLAQLQEHLAADPNR